MIDYYLDVNTKILEVHPTGPLQKSDFRDLTRAVDQLIAEKGNLTGIIFKINKFPGWENLKAMVAHVCFIKKHHKNIDRIALVTDSKVAKFAKRIASKIVSKEVKRFSENDIDFAKAWVLERANKKSQ